MGGFTVVGRSTAETCYKFRRRQIWKRSPERCKKDKEKRKLDLMPVESTLDSKRSWTSAIPKGCDSICGVALGFSCQSTVVKSYREWWSQFLKQCVVLSFTPSSGTKPTTLFWNAPAWNHHAEVLDAPEQPLCSAGLLLATEVLHASCG